MKLADIRLRTDGAAMIACLTGEIDMSNVGELQIALTGSTPNEAAGLVLDLSEIEYLDSAGIQLLIKLHTALRTRGQVLVLVVPDDSVVAGTFRLAGLSGAIPAVAHADEALARIAGDVA